MGSILLAACGGGGTQSNVINPASSYSPTKPSKTGGTVIYADWEAPADFNPITDSATTAVQAAEPIFSFLWTADPQAKYVPDLVTDIPTQENGMVKKIGSDKMDITIKLKNGLKYSDGSPITTNDVKALWQAECDPATGAVSTVGWDHITDMEIKSDTDMVWHFGPDPTGKRCGLSAPLTSGIYAPYLLIPYLQPIVPAKALLPHAGIATSAYWTSKPDPVSGPYIVQSFTPGTGGSEVMVPNPHYKDGRDGGKGFNHAPYLDKLIYKFYGDKAPQINGIRTGDSDVNMDLIAKDLPSLQNIPGVKVQPVAGFTVEGLQFNVGNNTKGCGAQKYAQTCGKPTIFKDDKLLRQAFDIAIDKDAINKNLVEGIGVIMNTFLPPTFSPWYDSGATKWKHDVSKAQQLMKQDGWTVNPGGISTKAGKECRFSISSTPTAQRSSQEEVIISSVKQLGCVGTPDNHPASEIFNGFNSGGQFATGQFDIGMYAGTYAADPDSWAVNAYISQIPTADHPSGQNWGRWNDQKLDQLFTQGANELDSNKRISIYKDTQKEWNDYMGWSNLYDRPEVFTYKQTVGNIFTNPLSVSMPWNTLDWFRKS